MRQQPAALRIDLIGNGPFELPALVQHGRIEVSQDQDLVVVEFLAQDGKRIFAAIEYSAVEKLVKHRPSAPRAPTAIASARLIDLSKPAPAYELPRLSSFDGHVQLGSDHLVLILSTERRKKFCFRLVLRHTTASLAP